MAITLELSGLDEINRQIAEEHKHWLKKQLESGPAAVLLRPISSGIKETPDNFISQEGISFGVLNFPKLWSTSRWSGRIFKTYLWNNYKSGKPGNEYVEKRIAEARKRCAAELKQFRGLEQQALQTAKKQSPDEYAAYLAHPKIPGNREPENIKQYLYWQQQREQLEANLKTIDEFEIAHKKYFRDLKERALLNAFSHTVELVVVGEKEIPSQNSTPPENAAGPNPTNTKEAATVEEIGEVKLNNSENSKESVAHILSNSSNAQEQIKQSSDSAKESLVEVIVDPEAMVNSKDMTEAKAKESKSVNPEALAQALEKEIGIESEKSKLPDCSSQPTSTESSLTIEDPASFREQLKKGDVDNHPSSSDAKDPAAVPEDADSSIKNPTASENPDLGNKEHTVTSSAEIAVNEVSIPQPGPVQRKPKKTIIPVAPARDPDLNALQNFFADRALNLQTHEDGAKAHWHVTLLCDNVKKKLKADLEKKKKRLWQTNVSIAKIKHQLSKGKKSLKIELASKEAQFQLQQNEIEELEKILEKQKQRLKQAKILAKRLTDNYYDRSKQLTQLEQFLDPISITTSSLGLFTGVLAVIFFALGFAFPPLWIVSIILGGVSMISYVATFISISFMVYEASRYGRSPALNEVVMATVDVIVAPIYWLGGNVLSAFAKLCNGGKAVSGIKTALNGGAYIWNWVFSNLLPDIIYTPTTYKESRSLIGSFVHWFKDTSGKLKNTQSATTSKNLKSTLLINATTNKASKQLQQVKQKIKGESAIQDEGINIAAAKDGRTFGYVVIPRKKAIPNRHINIIRWDKFFISTGTSPEATAIKTAVMNYENPSQAKQKKTPLGYLKDIELACENYQHTRSRRYAHVEELKQNVQQQIERLTPEVTTNNNSQTIPTELPCEKSYHAHICTWSPGVFAAWQPTLFSSNPITQVLSAQKAYIKHLETKVDASFKERQAKLADMHAAVSIALGSPLCSPSQHPKLNAKLKELKTLINWEKDRIMIVKADSGASDTDSVVLVGFKSAPTT